MTSLDRAETHWESYDGRKILIKDLEVRHLVNILNHMATANETDGGGWYTAELIAFMTLESELRIMVGWAANIGIPRQNEDGTWALINQTSAEKELEDAKTAMHQDAMKRQEIKEQRLTNAKVRRQSIKIQQLTMAEICN